jgi:L-galactose dehydrogenase
MEHRQLGGTGLQLSVVGFGASPLGDVFSRTDTKESARAVHFAIDHGINFFDVSPYYGETLAESRLGNCLAGYREKIVLATKCGRYGQDDFDFSAQVIGAGLEESLRRLRTDYVDLLQAHDVEFGDPQQIAHETIPAMRRLQEQGKARYIGITGYSLQTLIDIASLVQVDSILSYCHYNLMVNDMDAMLVPFAREHRIGLLNASALHMGILTEQGAPPWHPAPDAVRKAGRLIVRICREHGVEAPEVALRYCLDHPFVTSTLVGMSNVREVEAMLSSLRATSDPSLLKEISEAVAPVFNYVWPSGREDGAG